MSIFRRRNPSRLERQLAEADLETAMGRAQAGTPAEDMPPRPQARRQPPEDIPWRGAATVIGSRYDPGSDPCGAPAMKTAAKREGRSTQ